MHGRRKSTSSDRESRRVAARVYSGLLMLAFALFAALWYPACRLGVRLQAPEISSDVRVRLRDLGELDTGINL